MKNFDKNIDLKYENWYNALVDKAKFRGLDKKILEGYYEKHHILPKCLGGSDSEDNLVLLTYREHIIAHKLLAEIYSNNYKLLFAVTRMIVIKEFSIKKYFSTREIEYYRKKAIEELTESNIGRSHTEETKKILREAHIGKKLSESSKKKISIHNKGKGTKNIVGPDGTIYDSLNSCSKKLNIPLRTLQRYLHNNPEKGFKYKDSLTKHAANAKQVIDSDGIIYNSLTECSKINNISIGALKRWIKEKPEKGFKYYKEK